MDSLNMKITQKAIQERYKKQKTLFAEDLVTSLRALMLKATGIFLACSIAAHGFFSSNTIQNLYLSIFTLLFRQLKHSKNSYYIGGFGLLWLINIRCVSFSLIKFPDFSLLFMAYSMSVLYCGHMEMIYNPIHGFATIVVHFIV